MDEHSKHKCKVQRNFSRAANSYTATAVAQFQMATRLAESLKEYLSTVHRHAGYPISSILDAGCGNGNTLSLLQKQFPEAKTIVASDFSTAMLYQAPSSCQRVAADMERLPFVSRGFDLYWSNMAAQWCSWATFCQEAQRTLAPNGVLACSITGENTFKELKQAFAVIDNHQHIKQFNTEKSIEKHLKLNGFVRLRIHNNTYTMYYDDSHSLLHGIKSTGASYVGEGARQGLMSRSAWRKLEVALERQRTAKGLPLTYRVLLCLCQKE